LALAKDSIMRSLPSTFETSARTVGSLSSLFVYGLPLNYYSTLTGQVAAVNAQAVLAVSKKYLVPEKMVVIAVGDRSKIGAALEADLGPAELRDADGVVVAH
jgi:zinc protease